MTAPKHLLIAEDETMIRELLIRTFVARGYRVTAVGDGIQALEALRREPFDLLLTDIVMPELDGIGLSLKVSKSYPTLPILLMTGYAAEQQRAYNLESLLHDVILKPFTVDEVVERVEALLT